MLPQAADSEPGKGRLVRLAPMMWDGPPIVDRNSALENVAITAGHNRLELSMTSATEMAMEILLGRAIRTFLG